MKLVDLDHQFGSFASIRGFFVFDLRSSKQISTNEKGDACASPF